MSGREYCLPAALLDEKRFGSCPSMGRCDSPRNVYRKQDEALIELGKVPVNTVCLWAEDRTTVINRDDYHASLPRMSAIS
uniref:Transposase n=1 Tax=Steinernema glaseri TaxID=37863 RepID=A0A1I7ZIM7_9BILA